MSVTVVVVVLEKVEVDAEPHLNPVFRDTDADADADANSSFIFSLMLTVIEASMLLEKLCSSEYVAPCVTVYVQSALDLFPSELSQTRTV